MFQAEFWSSLSQSGDSSSCCCCFHVVDDGGGFSVLEEEDEEKRMIEPFFGKLLQKKTGVGLAGS